MEIRFCDTCSESIPDSDFDSGRAVTVDGRHYHVSCALTRSLALNGPRSWLTFLLALYAAGIGTFLLVAALGRPEKPDVVSAAVEQRILEKAAETRAAIKGERDRALLDVARLSDEARTASLETLREDVRARLDALGTRIDETDRLAAERVQAQKDHLERLDDEVGRLSQLIRETLARVEAEASRRVAPPPPQPVPEPDPPVEDPPEEEPTQPTDEPRRDPEHDAEVQKWIDRLRDPNENIRFSATLELGRLKDLRATPHLVRVLQEDDDYYVRLGAATALGEIRACDAVPALIEALDDKDTLVRTAASDALTATTGHEIDFQGDMSSRERRKVRKAWGDWWDDNEASLRNQLGQ